MVTSERYAEHKRWRSHGYTTGQACTMVRAYDTAHYVHRGGITPRIVHFRDGYTYRVFIYGQSFYQGNHPDPRIAYKQALWEKRIMLHDLETRDSYRSLSLGHRAVWENWHGGM